MRSIIISSESFIDGSLIDVEHKNQIDCASGNYSPAVSWETEINSGDVILSYTLVVERANNGISGTSPDDRPSNYAPGVPGVSPNGGKELLWYVDDIGAFLKHIGVNEVWNTSGINVFPSDNPLGDDRTNGWNGPCDTDTYEMYMYMTITDASYISTSRVKSNILSFTDNINNTGETACGQPNCPPGYTFNGDDPCFKHAIEDAIHHPALLSEAVSDTLFGCSGARFYKDVSNLTWPLHTVDTPSGTALEGMGILHTSDSTEDVVPYDTNYTHEPWANSCSSNGPSRMYASAVWAMDFYQPNEWIGFARTINLTQDTLYHIAIGGKDKMRIKLNGEMLAVFDSEQDGDPIESNYRIWHVLEITLPPGRNVINFEAYNEETDFKGALAYEIYKLEQSDLSGYDSYINRLNGYLNMSSVDAVVVASSKDHFELGSMPTFHTGEITGWECTIGTFDYDDQSCLVRRTAGESVVNCGYRIQNCINPSQEYIITATDLLIDGHVYIFENTSPAELVDICWRIVEIYTTTPPPIDFLDVDYDEHEGVDCCESYHKFKNCETNALYIIEVNDLEGSITPVLNQIYQGLEGSAVHKCITYLGLDASATPNVTEFELTADWNTQNCGSCLTEAGLKIQNCNDTNEEHVIKTVAGTTLSPTTVYRLDGNPILLNKCWLVIGEVVEPITITDVTLVLLVGKNCTYCPVYSIFQRCDDPRIYIIVDLLPGQTIVTTTLYQLQAEGANPNPNCWIYVGPTVTGTPAAVNVTATDLETFDCSICTDTGAGTSCYKFKSCADDTIINTTLADSLILTVSDINTVFTLTGPTQGGIDFTGECWRLIDIMESCPDASLEDITPTTTNCVYCSPCLDAWEITKCSTGETMTIYFESNSTLPTRMVYTFGWIEGCWTAVALPAQCENPESIVIHTSSEIINQFEDCEDCNPVCYAFSNCDTGIVFNVELADDLNGNDLVLSMVYSLVDYPDCAKYMGIVDCENLLGVITGFTSLECNDCAICKKYYKITNCVNPTEVHYAYWEADTLDETASYFFNFLTRSVCYNVVLDYTVCPQGAHVIHTNADIIETFTSCTECNAVCYKITICETGDIYYSDSNLNGYVGDTISFEISGGRLCGLIEEIPCRDTDDLVQIVPIGCVESCEECNPIPIPPEPEESEPRPIKPGYIVPPCTPNKQCEEPNYKCDCDE